MPVATSLNAGFMVVHGNRLDELRSLVVSWMRMYPLAPLENEIALVQSNGIAQWLKLVWPKMHRLMIWAAAALRPR